MICSETSSHSHEALEWQIFSSDLQAGTHVVPFPTSPFIHMQVASAVVWFHMQVAFV